MTNPATLMPETVDTAIELPHVRVGPVIVAVGEGWQEVLQAFTRRNAGRRCVLELDDPDIGAQLQESGYAFLGASYDPHDGRVELMIGGSHAGASHVSLSLVAVRSIGVLCDRNERDLGLCLANGRGQTLLRFLPDR